ncbi:MAG: site-specific DNA-methyltransferase, partial [Promethearchaeota archaeon]
EMRELPSSSISLIITSPPYPMIEMWDALFSSMNSEIKEALEQKEGKTAFRLMHQELEKIWKECKRVLVPGGITCVNIGDATRKLDKTFQLYPNHVKITEFFNTHGFISLPFILWRKPTNSPTKFLGSGMLPPNAYITLEHEYILIFKKGNKSRHFPPKSENRYKSAYFWEERNTWFSDVWMDIQGTSQFMETEGNEEIRERSAAYPLELPYRLINMFSVYGDTILDPFWGTGTTTLAAMVCARNSIGYEINSEFKKIFESNVQNLTELANSLYLKRLNEHKDFIKEYQKEKKEPKYTSIHYDFPVITKQEQYILIYSIDRVKSKENNFIIKYKPFYHYEEKRRKKVQSRLFPNE